MANLFVTGLPWAKESRALVKKALRDALGAHGGVVNLTWGNRKGTCFAAMDSALAASKAILKMNDQKLLVPGVKTVKLRIQLDENQGLKPPALEFDSRMYEPADDVPLSFTSRQGRIAEDKEINKEKRWRADQMTWCSICDSKTHTSKACSSDVPQYHAKVVLGAIPAGAPLDDTRLVFGPLPPEIAADPAADPAALAAAGHAAAAPAGLPGPTASGLPGGLPGGGVGLEGVDWTCGACSNLNWARRMACNRCGKPKPPPPPPPPANPGQGDSSWGYGGGGETGDSSWGYGGGASAGSKRPLGSEGGASGAVSAASAMWSKRPHHDHEPPGAAPAAASAAASAMWSKQQPAARPAPGPPVEFRHTQERGKPSNKPAWMIRQEEEQRRGK